MLNICFIGDSKATIAGTKWALNLFRHIPHKVALEPKTCDLLVSCDITTNDNSKNEACVARAQKVAIKWDKPLVVFVHDDPDQAMSIQLSSSSIQEQSHRLLVFRTSLSNSLKAAWEQLLPSFQAEDQGVIHYPPATCSDPAKPKVGFCGVARWPSRKAACEMLLENKELFDTDFVFRYDHHTRHDKQDQIQHKKDFDRIMQECPYQLCCRGGGNFSHRFYETLAAGRIPVLIDTDMVVPPQVPKPLWDRCVVMSKDAEHLKTDLLQFHQAFDVGQSQTICRVLWQQHFCYKAFATHVKDQISTLY